LILWANWSVLVDSTTAEAPGFIVQITGILALQDREGCSILISLEFRNGTWSLVCPHQSTYKNEYCPGPSLFSPLAEFSAKVEITLPNVSKLYNG